MTESPSVPSDPAAVPSAPDATPIADSIPAVVDAPVDPVPTPDAPPVVDAPVAPEIAPNEATSGNPDAPDQTSVAEATDDSNPVDVPVEAPVEVAAVVAVPSFEDFEATLNDADTATFHSLSSFLQDTIRVEVASSGISPTFEHFKNAGA